MTNEEKKILMLLSKNARMSNQDVADQLGLDAQVVEACIDSLRNKGILCGFTTIINDNDAIDFSIRALVELSISPQKDTGYDAIAKRIGNYPNVVSHYLVSGQYDFLVVVEGRDHKDVAHFVFDKLATLEHVSSTTTHFIFKTYKEQGVLFESSDLASRIPILP